MSVATRPLRRGALDSQGIGRRLVLRTALIALAVSAAYYLGTVMIVAGFLLAFGSFLPVFSIFGAAGDFVGGTVSGAARGKGPVISFEMKGAHAHDVATVIDRPGIAVRAGTHCVMPLLERFNVTATCRASFGMYNTREEVDHLAQALIKAALVARDAAIARDPKRVFDAGAEVYDRCTDCHAQYLVPLYPLTMKSK